MSARAEKRIRDLTVAIEEQRAWMARCGGDLEGYVDNYGSRRDADHAGDGGEAIWAADYGALVQLMRERSDLEAKLDRRARLGRART